MNNIIQDWTKNKKLESKIKKNKWKITIINSE